MTPERITELLGRLPELEAMAPEAREAVLVTLGGKAEKTLRRALWERSMERARAKRAAEPTKAGDLRAAVELLDHEWAGRIRACLFSSRILLDGVPVTDTDEARAAIWLTEQGCRVSSAVAHEAMAVVAERRPIHPVRDWLSGLQWDGIERAGGWLVEHMGASGPLVAEYGLRFLVGMVARVFSPGCKLDTMLVLVGEQGARKSSGMRALVGPEWFADATLDVRDKDARQGLSGVWLHEWPELDTMRRSEATAVKAFLSSPVDRYRPSYGRNTVVVPRQTVFFGTTNDREFLADPTGSRRFWPVDVGAVDLDGIEADREQLFAEAVAMFLGGQRWWLEADDDVRRAEESERWATTDPWEEAVRSWMARNDGATVSDVLAHALSIPVRDQGKGEQARVTAILRRAGYEKRRVGTGGSRAVRWTRDTP